MLQNRWLALILAVFLAAVVACGNEEDPAGDAESGTNSESAAVEEALQDLPDVVATVNGEEITKDEFAQVYTPQAEQAAAAAQQGGKEQDEATLRKQDEALRKQVVDNLVTQELLAQEASSRGIEPTDEQVQQTLDDAAKQSGMQSADDLIKALKDQGLNDDQVNEQAKLQTSFQLLVKDEAGEIKATDAAIRKLYKQAKKQSKGSGQKMPALKEIRDQLAQQVVTEQETKAADALIAKLRKAADIQIKI